MWGPRPLETVERVLKIVQAFEPPGVGARDLSECLLIQLHQREGHENYYDLELAKQVVRLHMEDLTKRRVSRVTRALGVQNEDLKTAMAVVEDLHPTPSAPTGPGAGSVRPTV